MEIFQDADLRQIHIQTQILLNLILTLVIKHLSIINKDNLSTPQRLLEVLSSKLLCDAIFCGVARRIQRSLFCEWSFFTYIIITGSQSF